MLHRPVLFPYYTDSTKISAKKKAKSPLFKLMSDPKYTLGLLFPVLFKEFITYLKVVCMRDVQFGLVLLVATKIYSSNFQKSLIG